MDFSLADKSDERQLKTGAVLDVIFLGSATPVLSRKI
jgi:hypothetical protein